MEIFEKKKRRDACLDFHSTNICEEKKEVTYRYKYDNLPEKEEEKEEKVYKQGTLGGNGIVWYAPRPARFAL